MTSTTIARLFCSLFGIGFSPKAPGTLGSFGAIIIWYIVTGHCDDFVLSTLLSVTTVLGLIGTAKILSTLSSEGSDSRHGIDPQFIVIDEVVGMWLAAFTLNPQSSWVAWCSAFILFRFFDIKKPWLVKKAENLPREFGVMADDIVAGIFSLMIMVSLQILFSI